MRGLTKLAAMAFSVEIEINAHRPFCEPIKERLELLGHQDLYTPEFETRGLVVLTVHPSNSVGSFDIVGHEDEIDQMISDAISVVKLEKSISNDTN